MLLNLYRGVWSSLVAPLIRRLDPQTAHHRLIESARFFDGAALAVTAAGWLNRRTLPGSPTAVGGVTLPHPIILAAGFVKGDGFASEDEALRAVDSGRDIIPGWRLMPALVGAVEFGSFTRHPRLGNPGRVIWRDDATSSTQNRVGLCNPGARAASCFLAAHHDQLPPVWGVNLAVTPGVTDPEQEEAEILEAASFFTTAFDPHSPAWREGQGVRSSSPAWYTLNLSCPNTEDDPGANQTEAKARRLCAALVRAVNAPVWVKVSPGLSAEQYIALAHVFTETGVRAVIATNTLGLPTPDGSAIAGVGGGKLRPSALDAIRILSNALLTRSSAPDLIACGGILTGDHLREVRQLGASAAMIYSGLVFRGPLAAALILDES